MSLLDEIARRNITEVVHFTSNHGLVGTLEMGEVLSRRRLPDVKHLAHLAAPTSATRQEASVYFDKAEDWLDFVNLSISEINQSYFSYASQKWHVSGDRWWTILSFKPEILLHTGVYFASTNNIYEHVNRGQGIEGLQSLFSEKIFRKGNWFAQRNSRAANLPTCQQAEVLYPHTLSIDYLQRIYVANEDDYDVVSGWLSLYRRTGIDVTIQREKFNGAPN